MPEPIYVKELIEIPEHVAKGDFVLRLSEGITDPEGTVRAYQVTPQLVTCFDQALKLVKGAISGNTSKAAYLHGSFGSGKSHFMAILHLILKGEPCARSIPELAEVIAENNSWTAGKKFLLVPYHLIAAKNLESAILGGYVEYIHRHFPKAHTPAVFRSEGLLANAEQLRETMGDDLFFGKLNETLKDQESGGWGNISATWSRASYDEARDAAPSTEVCRRLIRDLVETHFPAMRNTDEYVDLDDGLSIISTHAKELGFQAVILFLDELILWLASYAADPVFVSREGQKVVKLVESDRPERPVPIVSFVARQRDLRELVGQHVTGAEKLAFADVLNHHDGRFSVIRLEDRNLPAIASKRILLPKNDEARRVIDQEFARTSRVREEVMNTLLTRNGNRDDFRKLYPFSPALVETLVAVSSLLQRERTALKVMAMLMVEQRETLHLSQIVPVGDLFDQVSQGDEAFSPEMRIHFENAHRLYQQHLKPLLEQEHDITFERATQLPYDDVKRRALRNDDRLVKTLLLAALVPEVEVLKNMTPSRLAALNHGTIKTPIAGQEATTVLNKFRKWAASAGQIKIRDGAGGQTISLQISGVNVESILAQAEAVDNTGNRIRRLKDLLFEQLGVGEQQELFFAHPFRWRGTDRKCDIVFQNIRELPDETIRSKGDQWTLLIDYPFDPMPGHTVREDLTRLENFQKVHQSSRTICWIPSFFKHETLKALGLYVRLEQILKENQFPTYVQHLNAVDRESARSQLDNQREQLRSQLRVQIERAYGLRSEGAEYLDPSNSLEPSDQFSSLDKSLALRPPVAATMAEGLKKILDQALQSQFPAHPIFDEDLNATKGTLNKVLEVLRVAAQSGEQGILVEQPLRKSMLRIAAPLKLGEMGENRFQLGDYWKLHFTRQPWEGPLSVGRLRVWIDLPNAMGLPEPLQDLIILSYAEQTNRVFKRMGSPVEPEIGNLENDAVLEVVTLPSEANWVKANDRAKAIFGIPQHVMLNSVNLSALTNRLSETVKASVGPVGSARNRVSQTKNDKFPQLSDCQRLNTLMEAEWLLGSLSNSQSPHGLVNCLAEADLRSSSVALGASIGQASAVDQALKSADWDVLTAVKSLEDSRKGEADRLLEQLAEAFQSDEYAVGFVEAMAKVRSAALKLISKAPQKEPNPVPPVIPIIVPIIPQPGPDSGSGVSTPKRKRIQDDVFPGWLKQDLVERVQRTHRIGDVELVVSPTMKALLELDPNASIEGNTLKLHGWTVPLNG